MTSNNNTKFMESLTTLPSLKNVDLANLKPNAIDWRKGEKPTFNILSLLLMLGIGYVIWVFVLPILFGIIKIAVIGISLIMLYLCKGIIWSKMKWIVRKLHEAAIRHDPWGTFDEQRDLLVQREREAIKAESTVLQVEQKMQTDAEFQEEEARRYSERLIEIKGDADKLKKELASYTTEESKESERFTDIMIQLNELGAESERITAAYNQCNDLVIKLGSRANKFKKFRLKFKYFLSAVRGEVKNFDMTVKMLKNDFLATSSMEAGTDAVRKVMNFEDEWQVKYAIDITQTAIANKLANTKANLVDINDIMASINMNTNPDKAFASLDKLTSRIADGSEKINDSGKYKNVTLELSSEENKKSGFGDITF